MTRIVLVTVILVLLSGGTGAWLLQKLKIEQKGFSAPVGFAAILASFQLLIYPAQLFNLSFSWVKIAGIAVLTAALIFTIIKRKDVVHELWTFRTLWVLGSVTLFFVVFSQCYIDLDFSDSATYLNYIAQNINASHLNLFNPINGITGQEWDVLYLFQGFYHFGSFLCWGINAPYNLMHYGTEISNLVISVWTLGMLYNALSSMLITNLVHYFRFKSRFLQFSILIFSLFFTNFFYWKMAFAFYGNTYRGMFVTMLIYCIYRWIKEDNNQIRYLILFITTAGLACSSSYLFLSFEILYSLAAFLFYRKISHALEFMLELIAPVVLYAGAFLSRGHAVAALVLVVLYLVLLLYLHKKKFTSAVNHIGLILSQHAKEIFFIGIPFFAAAGSLWIRWRTPDLENTFYYSHYFWNFRSIDMVKDYLFAYSGWFDNVLNVLRWAGVVLLIVKYQTEAERFIRDLMILMITFFLNPLCTILLSKTITGIVYYRAFEILFNPFTEILLFNEIYMALNNRRVLQGTLEVILAGSAVLGQTLSWRGSDNGLYSFYLKGGKDVDPVYKTDPDEKTANEMLRDYAAVHPQTDQVTLVSQSNATRTYLPNAYQIFTSRDYFYTLQRLDPEFYEIAKRHYYWLEPVKTDYSKTCSDLKKYKVDYLLLQYWENADFDHASDACAVTIYTGSKYKVKKVQP